MTFKIAKPYFKGCLILLSALRLYQGRQKLKKKQTNEILLSHQLALRCCQAYDSLGALILFKIKV